MADEPRASAEDEGWEDLGGVSAHAWRSQEDSEALRERIAPYLEAHKEVFAGLSLQWDGEDATVVVGFTGDLDLHRAALEPLGVRVELRKYSEGELEGIAATLFDFADTLDGVIAQASWADPEEGHAILQAVTGDPDALRAALAERYGDRAALEWLGPDEHVACEVSFDAWELGGDDRTITVGWNGGAPEPLPLVIDEHADRVVITASELTPVGAIAAFGLRRTATATLARPLAERTVIDGLSGKAVVRGRVSEWREHLWDDDSSDDSPLQDAS